MTETRLCFYSPHLSKANLADLLESLVMQYRYRIDLESKFSELNSDPAIVALVGAAGTTVAALIQGAVQVYLEWKRKTMAEADHRRNGARVSVRVSGSMGESWFFEVDDATQIDAQLLRLPKDPSEISRIRME